MPCRGTGRPFELHLIDVPVPLLDDHTLNDGDRRLWMIMQYDHMHVTDRNVYEKTYLAARSHHSRTTIYSSLARLAAAGWYNPTKPQVTTKPLWHRYACVSIPDTLVFDENLSDRDIIAYCRLAASPYRMLRRCSYKIVANILGFCVNTAKKTIAALARASWLIVNQKHQKAPVWITMDTPYDRYIRRMTNLFTRRLERAEPTGELIAQSMIEVLTNADFCARGFLSFLRNPETDELLQVDFWFPEHRVAIEYNGDHHNDPEQQRRDEIKAKLLKAKGITLIVLTAVDLSLDTIGAKLKAAGIPLCDLSPYASLANYLNNRAYGYMQDIIKKYGIAVPAVEG